MGGVTLGGWQDKVQRLLWRVGPYLPFVLLASLVFCGTVIKPTLYCKPLMISLGLPSEQAIPNPAPHAGIDPDDIVRRFRYHPTGTEANSGIPYWVFKALPRMFPERFRGRGWELFGMMPDDGADYPDRGVPRGMAVVDTLLHLPGFRFGVSLKRVGINCSACHRGEIYDLKGQRVLIDGMPNTLFDGQGYKRFIMWAFAQPSFTAERLISTIDDLLGEGGHDRLTTKERVVYQALWFAMARSGKERSWMDRRPDNGPGRVSAFNSVKFSVIGAPDDGTIGTVDLPSIWNQRREIRRWHHWDGDTDDIRARNYGQVIGVGGNVLSIRGHSVDLIGRWMDRDLPVPKWMFENPDAELVAAGKLIFKRECQRCHGLYDPVTRTIERGELFMTRVDVGTDSERWKSFDDDTAAALNEYGSRRGVWGRRAFRAAAKGYLTPPLDGIWARAPYLHNGSVPTLEHLLMRVDKRPTTFYRGHRKYDTKRVGFVYQEDEDAGPHDKDDPRPLFLFDTRLRGNKNFGHEFFVSDTERPALLEYLKTL